MSVYRIIGSVLALLALISQTAVAENHAAAAKEIEKALHMTPDPANGKLVYKTCAVCHSPEGWGRHDGYYPQIAGQLYGVIIKQLADIRARNRDVPTMLPFAMLENLSVQDMADVAAYIAELPMTRNNGIGPGFELDYGETLYADNCAECHGKHGEGDVEGHMPRIQGQHYQYLVRQFRWIKHGKRRNGDPKMIRQIKHFSGRDIATVMDYTSRLRPPEEDLAAPDWVNPDFPRFKRQPWDSVHSVR